MLFPRSAANPASEPVLDEKAPPLTVVRDGVTYLVSLETWGAVLHNEAGDGFEVRSAASVAERTGIAETTIAAWLEAGNLDRVDIHGVFFAVPDAYGRYPVLDAG